MSAMDVSSVDTDDNTNEDQFDDNVLEPLSEVSFNEREKNCTMTSKSATLPLTTKTTDKDPSSLPDSRAKMLHLQRIARSGDSSSNDTVKSATSKKRNKSQSVGDTEKEETVSFSLESIIRRGLNDQKIKSNFNSNFKFGKPDDNISLRVNPTANLFYEIEDESGTDSSSDTYESSGERENTENTPILTATATTTTTSAVAISNNCITENGDLIPIEPRRKRGRPKMSEEQKLLRAAQKDALRLQNSNTIEPNTSAPTQVDELMAMGHSMFSEIVPRKRGRPKLKPEFNDEFNRFVGSTTSSTPNRSQNDDLSTTGDTNVSFDKPKVHKKRGRKPKSYHLEMARLNQSASLDDDTNEESNERASTSLPLTSGPKRRGRKPRQIQDYYVKLERPLTPAQYNQQLRQNESSSAIILKKKRGRKTKAYHEQMAARKLNQSAPASILQIKTDHPSNQNNITVSNRSSDMLVWAKRRGRKPKAYYEQLAALQPNSQSISMISNSTSMQSEKPSVSFSDTILSSDGPPTKKKRGRKPKSYYLELQKQQQQHQPQSILTNFSTTMVRPGGGYSSHIPNNLPKKRGPKPGSKRVVRKSYVKMIPFHQRTIVRRTGIDIPPHGFQIKKKRGRKPKNYQPEMEQHNGPVETNNYSEQLPIEIGLALENEIAADNYASSPIDERFIKIFQKQYDEIRILKQRLANLNPNEANAAEIEITENIPEPPTLSYTKSEMCKAYCLQRQNIPMFTNLHKQFSIPLPSVDEVREFVSEIEMVPGMQSTMLKMLDFDGQLVEEFERFTILQVSEIRTSSLFEYDDRLDRIWKPQDAVYMIVARGLYKDWSQLVYLSLEMPITKTNLFSVIEALHKINYPVVAVSTNFKEGKDDIYTEMSIGHGKNFFMHPLVPQKIFCFYYLSDLLEATNAHFCAGALSIEEKASRDAAETRTALNKQTILLAIQGSYRRISIPREVLAWTDTTIKDLNFLEKFYSQFTLNMLQLTLQDNVVTRAIVEFVSIMKTLAEIMGRKRVYDSDSEVPDFDKFIDCQNRKINRFHDRIFKLQFATTSNETKKFREAILMSIVSLTMLRKSILEYYKYPTFSTAAIANDWIRAKLSEKVPRSQYDKDLSPMQLLRALKMILFDERFGIKTEPKYKLFYNGPVTAAEVNGRNEAFYATLLLQWLCDDYTTKHPNANPNDVKDLKRKLKKTEEHFCRIQNPNFRIMENVVAELTKRLTEENASETSMDDILQIYIIQRLLLRIEYFNQNNTSRIPSSVQVSIDLE